MTDEAHPVPFVTENHRYRFWCLFPSGDIIELSLVLPGRLLPGDADALACVQWAHAVMNTVDGAKLPASFQDTPFAARRMTETMARHIINTSSYEVKRPGEAS